MKIIDLSTPLYSGMEVYPKDPKVSIEIVSSHENEGWELRQLSMGSHTGTYVDAFSHMHPGQENLDQIPIERFLGKAQVVRKAASWPTGAGLLFKDTIEIADLDKIVACQPLLLEVQ